MTPYNGSIKAENWTLIIQSLAEVEQLKTIVPILSGLSKLTSKCTFLGVSLHWLSWKCPVSDVTGYSIWKTENSCY